MIMYAPFYKNLETGQIWEGSEKLAKVAPQRGLIPYYPDGKGNQLRPVAKMAKVELEVEANRMGVKLNRRKSIKALREEVQSLRDNI